VAAARVELHAELARARDLVRGLGRGDQGLRGDDVGQHGRTADTGAFDERDVGSELGAGERGLVSPGASAQDDDAVLAVEGCGHALNLASARRRPWHVRAHRPPDLHLTYASRYDHVAV